MANLLIRPLGTSIEHLFETGTAWLQVAVPNPANAQPNTLIALRTDLHRLESVLLERKLAVIAERGTRRSASG